MTERINQIKEDLETVKDLVVLAQSNGGKQLLKGLTKDIVETIDTMVENRTVLTHEQFISYACDIKSKLDVVRAINKAKDNEDFLNNELKDALQQ